MAVLAALLGIASPAGAAQDARIFGGPALTDPSQAPWSVLINQTDGTSTGSCTGSIISASQILTAAHCTISNPTTGTSWPITGYTIAGGIVAVGTGADTSRRQLRTSAPAILGYP